MKRIPVIAAALTALFLGALDALIMAAAMPTIVADLGGLSLYSWVYSVYLLSRAVSLPVFGKLADLLNTKSLFMTSIAIFLTGSIMAGFSHGMGFLIFSRIVQGIGAGGNFALVYIVLTDMASPEKRGKTLGFASFVWGIASLLGPTLGGIIVSYFSWRWIFFMNIPLSILSLAGLYFFMIEIREKKKQVSIDISGIAALSVAILSLLTIFLTGGRNYPWISFEILGLILLTAFSFAAFYYSEKRAPEPILSLQFFKLKGFRTGNLAVFFSSFTIFSLFAYAPLFIQGVLLKTPMEVGLSMLSLSLGWSAGSLTLGQIMHRVGEKSAALFGAVLLVCSAGATLFFSIDTTMSTCFWVFLMVGTGMGFVALATLIVVQNSLTTEDLGVATSSHQFARTLGGTVGIGITGGLFTTRLTREIENIPADHLGNMLQNEMLAHHLENLFNPDMLAKMSESEMVTLQTASLSGFSLVFGIIFVISILCFFSCFFLPAK